MGPGIAATELKIPVLSSRGSERFHALDALRAVALLLGIALHAALSYAPGMGAIWAVEDRSTHWLMGAFVLVIHSFRLEVFFLIAGFFAHLMLVRRGLAGFTRNRFVRILVPCVCGWLLVCPWVVFGWTWAAMKAEVSAMPAALLQAFLVELTQLFNLVSLAFLKQGFILTHIWFLYYLLLVYIVFLSARALLTRVVKNLPRWQPRLDRFTHFLIHPRWSILLLAVPTWAVLLMMQSWGVDTPDRSLLPDVPVLLHYSIVFTLGWLLYRQRSLLEVIARHWRFNLLAAVVLMVPVVALSGYEWLPSVANRSEIRLGYLFLYALMAWSWVLAFIGVFMRFRRDESRFWRYLSDSSYWLYIVHLPLVVGLQVGLARFALPFWVKFPFICTVSAALLLISYQYLVRSTFIGLVLNGRRYPFAWVPSRGCGGAESGCLRRGND